MKKTLTLLMCMCLFGVYSCSSDDNNDGGVTTGIDLTVKVTYRAENASLPDAGSIVYLFENFDYQIGKWEYVGNGKYKQGDKEQFHYRRVKTDNDGVVVIKKISSDAYYTIVIEPKNGNGVKEDFLWKQNKNYNYSYEANAK